MTQVYQIGDFVGMVDAPPTVARVPRLWYLLRVHPNKEMVVADRLLSRDVCCYVPKELWSQRTGWNRRRLVEQPVFSGIVFVADYDAEILRLRVLTDGILGMVMFGGRAAYANAGTMAEIHSFEERLRLPIGKRRYKAGQSVRIVDGPFRWWEGPIERLDSEGRLRVLISVLGRQVSLPLDETQIEPA